MGELDLVGLIGIARMAGVSRQRAHQFTRMQGFPPAADTLDTGRVWRRSDVECWLRTRTGKGGRPRKQTSPQTTYSNPE